MRARAVGLLVALSSVAVGAAACGSDSPAEPDATQLAVGTWGGDTAAAIVADSTVHVHIGCTLGDLVAPVPLDADGRFTVAGTYVLRAYPIQLGPELPAQFSGQVRRQTLTLSVTVNDTVEKRVVMLGPVTVHLGATPNMRNCPICATPDRSPPGAVHRLRAWFRRLFSRSSP